MQQKKNDVRKTTVVMKCVKKQDIIDVKKGTTS